MELAEHSQVDLVVRLEQEAVFFGASVTACLPAINSARPIHLAVEGG